MENNHSNNEIHLHIDADAFFASIEQVLHRELEDKPIVVGQNGGIVAAMSYPAKMLGVPRVMPIGKLREKFPSVMIVASDYHAYGVFSSRMENIIKRRFPNLVKNSVDEGSVFMNKWVTSFQEAEAIARQLQEELYTKIGCRFSFGIARTPLLAKLASGINKPNGITVLDDENIKDKIYHLNVNRISGIGLQTQKKLLLYNIKTIGNFANTETNWLESNFGITMPQLQQQILGNSIIHPVQKDGIKSMSRDRTFTPTYDFDYLYSQMSMNVEHLARRMRKENLSCKRIGLRLRDQNLVHTELFSTLEITTRDPEYLLSQFESLLKNLYEKDILYRQVSVTTCGLSINNTQEDLFGNHKKNESNEIILGLIDKLDKKFGNSCIALASSIKALNNTERVFSKRTPGDTYPHALLDGEVVNKRLKYPYVGIIK